MKQEELLNQHLKIYLNSLEELIYNNTSSLINDDLLPLFLHRYPILFNTFIYFVCIKY